MYYDVAVTPDLTISAILDDPEQSPEFNVELDQYPVSMELLPLMQESLWKRMMSQNQQPIDAKNNRNDIPLPVK